MPLEAFPTVAADQLRNRSVGNLLRMGHCAPTVMQTMLDASDPEATWLVLLMAGLPGGIGNTGGECGGLTAPLALTGLRHGRDEAVDGLPLAVDQGHELLQRFTARCGTTQCREILIATMAVGGNALTDDVNKFNRVVNLGHDLARWFEARFGSTQCRTLTGCDFATADGVRGVHRARRQLRVRAHRAPRR